MLGSYAFYGCSGLTSIEIPSGVTEIPEYCFYNCTGMTEIAFPDSMTGIGDNAFYGCSGLTEIVIPDGVTGIGKNAFNGCIGVTDLVIPDSVSGIGTAAFRDCTGLIRVTIPISADYDCGSLGFASNATFDNCANVEEIHYTKGTGEAMQYSDYSGNSLPHNARTHLTTVTLEEGITEIPVSFLYGCSKFEEITLPDTVKKIGDSAFYGCSGISTVHLPFSADIISSSAFNRCTGLSDVYFDGSEMEAGGILIESDNEKLKSATWHYALENPDQERTLKLPGQLKVIKEEAFTGMGAEVIIIPASVQNINAGAFVGCAGLKAIIFEGSPESIANDIVTDPENVSVFVIKDSDTEAWARQSGFRVKYNLN